MITKKELQAALSGYSLIDKEVKEAAERYINKFGGHREHISSINEDCWYDDELNGHETIDIETEAYYCGCCGPDYEHYSIPLSYIWDKNWEEKETARREEAKRKKEEAFAQKKAEEDKEREEKRYANFLKMKEEYEGKDE